MRAFKKSLAVIISFIIIILTLTVSGTMAYASNGHKITVKSTQNLFNDVSRIYKPGDTFDLLYYIKASERMVDGTVSLKYDNSLINIDVDSAGNDLVEMGSKYNQNCISMGNYSENKGAYIYAYSSVQGNKGDYSVEDVLIKFTFKVSDSISKDHNIEFDIQALGAAGTKTDENNKVVVDYKSRYKYIVNSAVDANYSSHFSVRAALTGGSEVKPDETTSETTAATKPSETEVQSQPATAETTKATDSSETSTQPVTSQQSRDIYGDVNGDKIISIKDVTLIQKHIVRLTELSQDIQKKCDVNNDGQLNIKDATCIQWYLVKVSERAGRTGNNCA